MAALKEILKEEDNWMENGYLTSSSFSLENTWKDLKRNWGHSMHAMASRSGSFPPSLADYFIQNFSEAGDLVYDPFSGKGTTALQACISERKGVGSDIAPEAFILTAAKTVDIDHETAVKYLNKLEISSEKKLLKGVPKEVKVFYHDKTLAQIVSLKEELKKDFSLEDVDYVGDAPFYEPKKQSLKSRCAQYWMGVMMGILHGSSEICLSVKCSHSFSMSPGYVEKYSKKHGLKKPVRDIKECLIKRSEKLSSDGALETEGLGKAILGSAMAMPKSLKDKVDLIVTSPPYFNAQTYAWDNWLREWFLGFNFKEVRTQTLQTSLEDKYRKGMNEFLAESFKVLKSGRWSFVVVGDIIKKTSAGDKHIITANIIAEEALKVGFSVERIINDDIPPSSRYNSAFLKNGQGLKLDRIVCLYKS